MRTNRALFPIILFIMVSGAFHVAEADGADTISPSDIAGAPDKFCTVVKEPNPALLGGWKGVYEHFVPMLGAYRSEPVEYYLEKVGNRYALYFYRLKKVTDMAVIVYRGWRDWEINGDYIRSKNGVGIFAKDGAVYYSWKNDQPTRLSRDENFGMQ